MLRLIGSKDISHLTNERNVTLVHIVISFVCLYIIFGNFKNVFSKIFWLALSILYFYVIACDFLLRDTSGYFSYNAFSLEPQVYFIFYTNAALSLLSLQEQKYLERVKLPKVIGLCLSDSSTRYSFFLVSCQCAVISFTSVCAFAFISRKYSYSFSVMCTIKTGFSRDLTTLIFPEVFSM